MPAHLYPYTNSLLARDNGRNPETLNPNTAGNSTDPGSVTSNNVDWYWDWYAIKWAVFLGVLAFLLGIFALTYISARRRMRKGLPLSRYHRWLMPRSVRMKYEGRGPGRPGSAIAWPISNYSYGPPPPAYNPETDYVPAYSPPPPGFDNFSKVDPDQRPHPPNPIDEQASSSSAPK